MSQNDKFFSSSTPNPKMAQKDKFFSRVLSKENSTNPSFRVYYGVSTGSVPFLWESQPGTPKHPVADSKLPPLTPPPSYYQNSGKNAIFIKSQKQNFFHALIPRLKKTSFWARGRSNSSGSVSSSSSSSGGAALCCYSAVGMKRALLSIVGVGGGDGFCKD